MVMENFWKWMRRSVSPVFWALLFAAFILWYIAKLSYTYTTEHDVRLLVDGQPLEVTCVVEGPGANLFGYKVYSNKTLRIPLGTQIRGVAWRGARREDSYRSAVVAESRFGALQRY